MKRDTMALLFQGYSGLSFRVHHIKPVDTNQLEM